MIYNQKENSRSLDFQLLKQGNVEIFIPRNKQYNLTCKINLFSELFFSDFYHTLGKHISGSEIDVLPNDGCKAEKIPTTLTICEGK
jgi:hypothetical protein